MKAKYLLTLMIFPINFRELTARIVRVVTFRRVRGNWKFSVVYSGQLRPDNDRHQFRRNTRSMFPPTDHHLREPGGVPRRASARYRICNRRSCTHHPEAFPAIARDRPHLTDRQPAASNSINSSRATSRRNAREVPRRIGNCWRARIISPI